MNGLLLRPPLEPLERSVTMRTISVARPAAARLSGSEHADALAPSAATVTFRSLHKPSHSKITISSRAGPLAPNESPRRRQPRMEERGDRDRFEIEEETIKEAAERRGWGAAVAHVLGQSPRR